MINKKTLLKIATFLLCFVIFFSFTSTVQAAGFVSGLLEKLFGRILNIFSALIISIGDGILHIISQATGEVVTIDRLVFNEVGKLSIDYWEDISDGASSSGNAIKSIMAVPVQKWYPVFQKIAIMVYMIVLVYIGISIMLSSTGEKKAKFKELVVTWFTGVMILFMFPYVMKYVIVINDATVGILKAKAESMGYATSGGSSAMAKEDLLNLSSIYGKKEFAKYLGSANGDIMALTRQAAWGEKDDPQISLAILYLILVGQTIAILVMYYNRAFMLAFLITIFPLVAMTYVLDKIGDGKNQSFSIWFREFIMNVIIQMFHAVVYILIVGSSITEFLKNGGKNFIFTVLCVWFLFEGEKILRGIFGLKSKAKTMGDLAASGAMMWAIAGKTGGLFKRNKNDVGTAQDHNESEAAASRVKSKTRSQEQNEKAATDALNDKKDNGLSTDSQGEYQGKKNEPAGVSTPQFDAQNARDKLTGEMKRRLKGGLATRAVNFGAGAVGATVASTMALANGKQPGDVIGAIVGGKAIGQELATPLVKGVNAVERAYEGNKLARKIQNKEYDGALGIPNVDLPPIPPTMTMGDDINLDDVTKDGVTMQEVYREALAAYAKAAARGGNAKGEIAYFEYLEKNLKK